MANVRDQQKVVNGREVIVLIGEEIGLSSLNVHSVIVHLVQNDRVNWDFVLPDDDSRVDSGFIVKRKTPLMPPDVHNRDSPSRVSRQDPLQEALALRRYVLGDFEVSAHDFLVKEMRIGVFKWKIPAKQCKHDDSQTPNIHREPQVFFPSDHFRRCIARRATSRFKQLVFLVEIRKTKVHNFYVFFGVQKNVFGFEIPVDDPESVEVLDSR